MGPILDRPHVSAETLFHCSPPPSRSQRVVATILLGAILGGIVWFGVDRTFAWQHIALWLAGAIALVATLVVLLTDDPLLAVGVDDHGLTLVRSRGSRTLAWGEIEAARWQEYPVTNLHTRIRCLLLRAGGRTIELTPEFDPDTLVAFENALGQQLEGHDVPESSPTLPSFERTLSRGGAVVFAISLVGMAIAYVLVYRTLGTIVGLSLLFTGTIIAAMTHRQRLSRVILALTVLLIVAAVVTVLGGHISLRDTLNRWEEQERQLHHAPWSKAPTRADTPLSHSSRGAAQECSPRREPWI
jgi:hypothetical protein